MPRFVLDDELAGERIDKVLTRLMPGTSRASVQRWIDEGRVHLGGQPCRQKDVGRAGDVIDVDPGPAPPSRAEPDPGVEIDVLFEDAHLVVVNKPAGLVVHPARGHRGGTLVNGLLARPDFRRPPSDPRDPEGALRPGIVQRLDKDTSGVLVVAKDDATREGLKAQLAVHSVERAYLALTVGVPRDGTLDTFHGRHPKSRLRFTSLGDSGRRAVTHVSVIARLAGGRAALVRCRLATGRTHQIRVHLSEQCKTPILADALYGRPLADPDLGAIADALGRQALHAAVLGFVHPITGAELHFEAPVPDDFARARAALSALSR